MEDKQTLLTSSAVQCGPPVKFVPMACKPPARLGRGKGQGARGGHEETACSHVLPREAYLHIHSHQNPLTPSC